jgi:glycosyltransferase involved in cell wall biosynthesis
MQSFVKRIRFRVATSRLEVELKATAQQPATPFVVFSDDWGVHPSSSQHIFRHIAKQHPVAWINTVGMRRPRLTLSDLRKAFSKLSGMIFGANKSARTSEDDSIRVLQPLMIPFNDIALFRRINAKIVSRKLQNVLAEETYRDAIIVTTVPNACDYLDDFATHRVVYYCVDDFSEWPGLDKSLVLEMEAKLVRRSDAFLATSHNLLNKLAQHGKPTQYLPHGVDIDLFSTSVDTEHEVLAAIPKPRAGYFGLFDERSDIDLIRHLATSFPQVSFVIAGRVETATGAIGNCENVFFCGVIDYQQLPMLIAGLDVLFLPYRVNALSDALSPLKFKEYLATGLPIISTPIAAAKEFDRWIQIARSPAEWSAALEAALTAYSDERKEEILEWLAGETWAEKSEQFVTFCVEPKDNASCLYRR